MLQFLPVFLTSPLIGPQLSSQAAVSEQRMQREPEPLPRGHNQEAEGPGAEPAGPELGRDAVRMHGAEVADGEGGGRSPRDPLAFSSPARAVAVTAQQLEEKAQLRAAIKACLTDNSFHGRFSLEESVWVEWAAFCVFLPTSFTLTHLPPRCSATELVAQVEEAWDELEKELDEGGDLWERL